MPRDVIFGREKTPAQDTALCLDCGWRWVIAHGDFKTTTRSRSVNAAEKHVECLGHRVLVTREVLISPMGAEALAGKE